MRDVPISGGFRERYAYDSILFGVAQQVIEAASGMSYEQFLRTRIFGPLGMAQTRFNADYLEPGDNVATGHRSEEHTSEPQSLMRISYAGFCLKKKNSNKSITMFTTRQQTHNQKKT